MENVKKVLLVDDNGVLRHGMRVILEDMNYVVTEAENGREGQEILKANAFDLIVSDAEMPVMDGVQLLGWVRSQKIASRFLLISDFSHALQMRQALGLGADHFLNKPFDRTALLEAVAVAQRPPQDGHPSTLESDYVPVPLSDFITGSVLRVDLFVQLSSDKFLKIGHKGSNITPERVQGYAAKGVRWFHMIKDDFAEYVGFNFSLAQVVHSNDKIECARKIRLTMHITETLISGLLQSGLNREQLDNASNVVMNTVEMIGSNPSTLKLLENMEISGSTPSHAIAVAIWSCLIAKRMGWTGYSTFFRLSLCALFHDVGKSELGDEIIGKPRFELTRQERKILESHAVRGRDILQSVPGMPEDVAIVALQHHELANGGGYPYGLKLHQIHPLARIVAAADQRFCRSRTVRV